MHMATIRKEVKRRDAGGRDWLEETTKKQDNEERDGMRKRRK